MNTQNTNLLRDDGYAQRMRMDGETLNETNPERFLPFISLILLTTFYFRFIFFVLSAHCTVHHWHREFIPDIGPIYYRKQNNNPFSAFPFRYAPSVGLPWKILSPFCLRFYFAF